MKKIFTFVAAALISVSMMAVDGVNVMASGLKATVNAEVTEMTVDFVLNTAATGLTVQFFDAAGDLAAEVELEDAALLTAGAHQTTVEIPLDELEGGVYKWGILANGGTTVFENKLPVGDPRYSYYLPQDVVVDNSFESDYFGRIYISMPWEGESDGGTVTTQNQERGIYILDTQLETVNGTDSALHAYNGGLGGAIHTRNGFKRLAVDEAGYVYVSSRDDATKGVYRMDPAAPENPFVTVLAADVAVDGIETVNGKLITIEGVDGGNNGTLNSYDMTSIPVGSPTKTFSAPEKMLANADLSIRSDRRGGYWAVQYRYSLDTWPALLHMDKKFNIDYYVNSEMNPDLLSASNGNLSSRGALGVNLGGNLLALSSNKQAVVFSVEYDTDGIPTLTKLCETPIFGTNIDGVSFDAADNLYVVSASSERLYIFPIAKEEGMNHCLVKAAARYEVTIPGDLPQAPETAPEAPTKDEANVMAIYCNHYATNNANFGISGWAGGYETLDLDGTMVAYWTGMTWECIIDPANTDAPHDFSAYKNVHVDMWAPAAAKIKFTAEAIAGGNYKDGMVADLVAGWNSFDFAIAQWPGNYNFANMKCFVLEQFQTPTGESFEGNPFAIANIYFWNEPTSVENVAAETKAVKVVRDGQVLILRNGVEYNMLGTEMK